MLRITIGAALVAAAVLFGSPGHARAQEGETADGTVAVEEGAVNAVELLERWAKVQGKVLTVDPQITPIQITFASAAKLDALTLREVLDVFDIVVVERAGALEAHHRRNLNQKVGPPWDVVEGELSALDHRLVTSIVQVRHGQGNSIFATVRGLLTRDTNRIGNILYVQGPELIIIVDMAYNVRYYQQMIERLDQPAPVEPPPAPLNIRVYEVRRVAWSRVQQAESTAAGRARVLRAAATDASKAAVLLAEGQFMGAEPVSIERQTSEASEQTRLTLELGLPQQQQAQGQPGQPVVVSPRLVSPSFDGRTSLHLRVHLQIASNGSTLVLATQARVDRSGGPVLHSFTGRGGSEPSDIVVVLE